LATRSECGLKIKVTLSAHGVFVTWNKQKNIVTSFTILYLLLTT